MTSHNTQLQQFVDEEVSKVKGKYLPRHASTLERFLIRKLSCSKLHPNPYDEFCDPEIGPNAQIVNQYVKSFQYIDDRQPLSNKGTEFMDIDALFVQKIYPDGYMILNGHHRWAAAVRIGKKSLPVRIVNLTQEKDLKKMLEHAQNDKRITMDLDEVVFSPWKNEEMEKPLRFPLNRFYPERLRFGIPSLFSFFNTNRYDIWLYTPGYMSIDYIRSMMKLHHLHITGIVTGTDRKGPDKENTKAEVEALMNKTYTRTVYIDNDAVTYINSAEKDLREYALAGNGPWSAQIMDIFTMKKDVFGQA